MGGGGGLNWLALSAIFPSVISSFFTQNKGEGGAGPPGSSPRSATAEIGLYTDVAAAGVVRGQNKNERSERSDVHCRIKESLLIKDLKPSLIKWKCGQRETFTLLAFYLLSSRLNRSV